MVSKLIPVNISNLSKVVKLDDSEFFGQSKIVHYYQVDIICTHNRGVDKAVINNHSFCNKIIASDSTKVWTLISRLSD